MDTHMDTKIYGVATAPRFTFKLLAAPHTRTDLYHAPSNVF